VYLEFERYKPRNFQMQIGRMRKGSFSQISSSSSRRNSGKFDLTGSFLSNTETGPTCEDVYNKFERRSAEFKLS
jgi:hypothetical protein